MKKKKTVKVVKMHKFLVCAYQSSDFVQIQKKKNARLHDAVTVTFRNSDPQICSGKDFFKKL